MIKAALIAGCLTLCSLFGFAQDGKTLTLSKERPKDECSIRIGNTSNVTIKASRDSFNNHKEIPITLTIENDSNSNIRLFYKGHDKKQLRKNGYRIDKSLGITEVEKHDLKGNKDIELGEKTINVNAAKEGDSLVFNLPFYAVETRNNLFGIKRNIIKANTTIKLTVVIEENLNEEMESLKQESDSLIQALDEAVFCTNKSHRPTINDLKQQYHDKADSIKKKADHMMEENSIWPDNGLNKRLYDTLADNLGKKLDSIIDHKEKGARDCGIHKQKAATGNKCAYCNKSFSDVRNELNRIYNQRQKKIKEKKKFSDNLQTISNCVHNHKHNYTEEEKQKLIKKIKEINELQPVIQ